jgi:hypothetical protein
MNAAIISLIMLTLLVVAVVVYLLLKHKNTPSPSPSPPLHPADPKSFRFEGPAYAYAINSTDGKNGRDVHGNYLVDSKVVEKGIESREDALKLLNTPALVCPSSFTSWTAFALSTGGTLPKNINEPQKTLVITSPGVVLLNTNLTVKVLVVKNGGVLLFAGDVTVSAECILVESGGLLQAGSSQVGGKYRYNDKLTFLLKNGSPAGYGQMGVLCSQYSYKFCAPGSDPTWMSAQTGNAMVISNTMGAKCMSACFNGTIHLAGTVGPAKPYSGTWSARNSSPADADFLGKDDILTSQCSQLSQEYCVVWTKLAATAKAGSNQLVLEDQVTWPVGSKVVLTCCPGTYSGNIPIWMGFDKSDPNNSLNSSVLDKFKQHLDTDGVEVATIAATSGNKVTLRDALRFDHTSEWSSLKSSARNQSVSVDTRVHVGLLTRNIVVTSELFDGGGGCNDDIYAHKGLSQHALGLQGKSNKKPQHRNLLATSAPADLLCPSAQDGTWCGSGGSVHCNWANKYSPNCGMNNQLTGCHNNIITANPQGISTFCYTQRDAAEEAQAGQICTDDKGVLHKPLTTKGSYLHGTGQHSGCNALFGGQIMNRFGCSVRMDGVEVRQCGVAPNFGAMAQYSIHFHLAGYFDSFKGYLREGTKREGVVENSSCWQSFSRFVTLHGTHQAKVSNNVCFIGYGSGIFVEDGTETFNVIEHNLVVCTLNALFDPMYNPAPVYPNTSSDVCWSGAVWLKNNMNTVARNVLCCSPPPVSAIWGVPQFVSHFRGPSQIAIGDAELMLPALGTTANAAASGDAGLGLSADKKSKDGIPLLVGSPQGKCWSPPEFQAQGLTDTSDCVLFTITNSTNAPFLMAENVIYNISGGFQSNPGITFANGESGCDFQTPDAKRPHIWFGLGEDAWTATTRGQPIFMPANGQNYCTDLQPIGQDSYFFPKMSSLSPYWKDWLRDKAVTVENRTCGYGAPFAAIPKIFLNILCFSLAPGNQEVFGASWSHEGASWYINCCTLRRGASAMTGQLQFFSGASSGAAPLAGDPAVVTKALYHVHHNLITDSGFVLCNSPLLITGDKTFIADDSPLTFTELKWPTPIFFGMGAKMSWVPASLWVSQPPHGNPYAGNVVMTLFVFDENGKSWVVKDNQPPVLRTDYTQDWRATAPTTKFPFLCAGGSSLVKDTETKFAKAQTSRRLDIAAFNSFTQVFTDDKGMALAQGLCDLMGRIDPNGNSSGAQMPYAGIKCSDH